MAQRGINKVILIGTLGQDPEVRYMPSGAAVANLSIATSETWKDKATGEPRETTEWHRVSIFGKTAEVAGEYLRKGAKVYIEGQLKTRKWQDQQGQDRYTTEIVVQGYSGVMQMLGSKQDGQQQGNQGYGAPQHQGGYNQQPQQNQGYNQQPPQQNQGYQQPNQAPQNQRPPQNQQPAQQGYNEPPMDIDSEIPF